MTVKRRRVRGGKEEGKSEGDGGCWEKVREEVNK